MGGQVYFQGQGIGDDAAVLPISRSREGKTNGERPLQLKRGRERERTHTINKVLQSQREQEVKKIIGVGQWQCHTEN